MLTLHKLVLPQDILTGAMDQKKRSKAADLLQICQAWLPLFYTVIPFLMQVQDSERGKRTRERGKCTSDRGT